MKAGLGWAHCPSWTKQALVDRIVITLEPAPLVFAFTSYLSSTRLDPSASTEHLTMSTSYTVHVSGLAPETTDTKLSDFFS